MWKNALISVYALILAISGYLFLPFSIPVLPPQQFLADTIIAMAEIGNVDEEIRFEDDDARCQGMEHAKWRFAGRWRIRDPLDQMERAHIQTLEHVRL